MFSLMGSVNLSAPPAKNEEQDKNHQKRNLSLAPREETIHAGPPPSIEVDISYGWELSCETACIIEKSGRASSST